MAIRLSEPRQPDLIRHSIFCPCAPLCLPAYLAARGTPTSLEQLDDHQIIVYGTQTAPCAQSELADERGAGGQGPRTPDLTINNLIALRRASRTNAGIACLPDYLVRPGHDLVRIMPEIEAPEIQIFYAYLTTPNSQKVIAFRDFFIQCG